MNKITVTLSISFIFTLIPCQAEISTDGSMGVGGPQNLVGPHFDIKQELGTLSGTNLFHSFSDFNLDSAQSATFTGDAAIQNVISRVTGGKASSIDGTLKSDIGQAAVYFINPAGIVFGQHAKVDVPGAFYASTANELQFADGGKFSATNPQASSLSMATPAAFGFLGAQTGALALNGASLEFKTGATVQLSANKIAMDNAKIALDQKNLNSKGINLQLAAVGNAAQTIDIKDLPDKVLQGDVALSKTTLDASGNGGGRVAVRAGDVNAIDSKIFADNTGDKDVINGQSIDMKVNNLDLNHSLITGDTINTGNAGNVTVSAQNRLSIRGSEIHSHTNSNGNTGNVIVKAQSISISNGEISTSSDSLSKGSAGDIVVDAGNIKIDNNAGVVSVTKGEGSAGDVNVKTGNLEIVEGGRIGTLTSFTGSAGQVIVEANSIQMDNNAEIVSYTAGQGNAGDITVKADVLKIDSGSLIKTLTSSNENKGNAGNVNVRAGTLNITNDGQVSSISSSNGSSGQIAVEAEKINMDNGALIASKSNSGKSNVGDISVKGATISLDNGSFIGSLAKEKSQGNAGKITVISQNGLSVSNGSAITSISSGEGAAGNITVEAKAIGLSGKAQLTSSAAKGKAGDIGIKTDSLFIDEESKIQSSNLVTGGQAGAIIIDSGTIQMNGESNISVDTYNNTKAGNVNVNAQSIQIGGESSISSRAGKGLTGDAGTISITAQNDIKLDRGLISAATFGQGNAGKVEVTTQKNLTIQNNGIISSDTWSIGKAGEVIVNGKNIQIEGSGITSVALKASSGNAGNVFINAQGDLSIANGALILSNTNGGGAAGTVNISAENIRIDKAESPTRTIVGSMAGNDATGKAGAVTVSAQKELAVLNGGEITSSSQSQGDAGSVTINAETVRLDGQGSAKPSSISSDAGTDSSNAGSVVVTAQGKLSMDNGALISSSTDTKGNGGNVNVKAGAIQIDGHGYGAAIASLTLASGNAGIVNVTAQNELAVVNAGRISSDTLASGKAGTVVINAETVKVDGQGTKKPTNISSNARENSTGDAGFVTVNAQKSITLANGGEISSNTSSQGNGGDVNVTAETIEIEGYEKSAGISSLAGSTGNAGTVTVIAQKELNVIDRGAITSSTVSKGNGGRINISAGTIRVDGKGHIALITSSSLGNGNAGTVKITAQNQLEVVNKGQISTNAFAEGSANAIEINTNTLLIASDSQVTTTTNQGNGGPISINANDWLFLNNSQITTSVTGKDNGNGGDITLNGDILILDSGFIQANTNATKASGGNINLNIKQLVAGQDNLQRGGSAPLTFIPNSGLNVIQAASPTGVNGNINISAPQLNIVGALVGLNTPELDLSRVRRDPCSDTMRQSSLKKLGKGGVPFFNKGQDGYTIDHLLDVAPQDVANTQHSANTPNGNPDCKPKLADKPLQQALTY